MNDSRDARSASLRRPDRLRAGRHLVGARPRQPDRRAHRLQRRLRAAVRDRPPHHGRPRAPRRRRSSGSRAPSPTRSSRCRCATRPTCSASGGLRGWSRLPARGRLGARRRRAPTSIAVPGCDLLIDSDVPVGAGLSSSAAIECAVAVALDEVWELGLTARRSRGSASAPRTRSSAPRPASWTSRRPCSASATPPCSSTAAASNPSSCRSGSRPPASTILVIDTGVQHDHATGGYARAPGVLRARCRGARRRLPARPRPSTTSTTPASALDDVTFRRVRHVVTENERVLETVAAAARVGPGAIGELLDASHRSLRDDFEISVAELDLAVETAQANGAIGARMTGGGFGGSAIALVPSDAISQVVRSVARRVRRARLRRRPTCSPSHRPTARDGTTTDDLARHRRRRLHRRPRRPRPRRGRASRPSSSTTSPAGIASSCPRACRSSTRASSTARPCSRRLAAHDVSGVIHLAGFKYAGVSVEQPLHTYEQNVDGHGHAARRDGRVRRRPHGVLLERGRLRNPRRRPRDRADPDRARVAVRREQAHRRVAAARPGGRRRAAAHLAALLQRRRLRRIRTVYDTSPHNLFPLVFEALLDGRTPRINGDDYPTPDGTCVRDYLHVADLALAHVAAARRLEAGDAARARSTTSAAATASRCAEIMAAIARVTGIDFEPEVGPRRPGDPPRIVASGRARRARPRLDDAPHARRDGRERLGGAPRLG